MATDYFLAVDRARAYRDSSPVVVRIVCDRCGNREVGRVVRTPAGLLLLTERHDKAMTEALRDPEDPLDAQVAAVTRGVSWLISHPDVPAEEVAAYCPGTARHRHPHGDLPVSIAEATIAAQRSRPGRPAVIRVHPSDAG